MATAVFVSYRLGAGDGVSVEAAKWAWALGQLGFAVRTVAGAGAVDHRVPGLAMDARQPPARREVAEALEGADVIVVENLCSLPLNPAAGAVVADVCRGRPTLLHHHDLPWQRPRTACCPPPPDDPAWRHVTINRLSRDELRRRGINAVTIYNAFDTGAAPAAKEARQSTRGHRVLRPDGERRDAARRALGVDSQTALVLQPTRALYRKNVPGGVALAERLDASYWLLGPAEEGFGPSLEQILGLARCPVSYGRQRGDRRATPECEPASCSLNEPSLSLDEMASAYAACDIVVLPSLWEGFGNATIESALHRRPLVVGPFPVARELAAFGFRWFALADVAAVRRWLADPDPAVVDHNLGIARRHFALEDLPGKLAPLLEDLLR